MRRSKRLTIDLRWIDSSGVGVYIQGIMPGVVAACNDVLITGLGDRERLRQFPWAQASNVQLVHCGAPRYSIAEQRELPGLIPRETDLFFSPYYTFPLLYRGRLAVTVHDMSHRVVREIISNPKKRIYARLMYAALARRASLFLTVSEFSKRELLRLEPRVRSEQVVTTPLGVSPAWEGARELPPVREGPYLVSVGNVKPYKNVARLLQAFQGIKHQVPHTLVIVGQYHNLITGESPAFFASVREAGDRVQLTGAVSQRQLLSLIAHADALVMPSLYEGFGLTVLEAMAAGTPVVCSSAASLPEVGGDAVLYFDPLDPANMAAQLVKVANDGALRDQLRQRGLERSQQFRWEQCAERTAWALQQVMNAV